jgi:predicted nuclease of restriction endonuclease-like (RecB) superfamily
MRRGDEQEKRSGQSGKGHRICETAAGYASVHGEIVALLQAARRAAARSVNALMTATYWEIGRRIVEFEQGGEERAGYGADLIKHLGQDLSRQFGRGFGWRNLAQMRAFYLVWPTKQILQTLSAKSACPEIWQTASAKSTDLSILAQAFPLPWSAYVCLLSVKNEHARAFYETEALRGGWSVRQLNRQIDSQFYERTALSRNKAAMLQKGEVVQPGDAITPEEVIKDPYVLEFLDLKDEYSESELEDALIHRLQDFLLELGSDFTFVARQRRLRIGDSWYRVDLLFFHRRPRCLVIIDLKLARLNHADVGQMHMYCNYAREHWTLPGENPPIGLILCARHDEAVARYALDGLPNKVLAAEYRTVLPDEKLLADELAKARRELEARRIGRGGKGGKA